MRLGVDASSWINGRGFGRYTRGLLTALLAHTATLAAPPELVAIVDQATAARADLPDGIEVVVAPTRASATDAASSRGRRALGDLWAMRAAAGRATLDLLVYPTVYTYFPPPARLPTIVTIHDATPERHPRLVFPNRRLEFFWRLKALAATRRATLIVTASRAAARDISRWLWAPSARVRVIGAGVAPCFEPQGAARSAPAARRALGLDEGTPLLLAVGGFSPHKNLEPLIEAVARLHQRPGLGALRLALVGDYQADPFHSAYPALRALTRARGLEERVIFTGRVSDEELVGLYGAATALALPSISEGFGFPAIEALACGTPVVAARAGSLPEVVGPAGLFFEPHDVAELEDTLRHLLTYHDLQADLARRGPPRAACFTWGETARRLLAACVEVVPNAGGAPGWTLA